jgi:hypothetical protein
MKNAFELLFYIKLKSLNQHNSKSNSEHISISFLEKWTHLWNVIDLMIRNITSLKIKHNDWICEINHTQNHITENKTQ